MAPITNKHHKYSSLVDEVTETSSFIHDSEKTELRFQYENERQKSKLRTILPWLVHLVFILTYIAIYVVSQRSAKILEGFDCE